MVILQRELFDQIAPLDRVNVPFCCPLKGAKHVASLALEEALQTWRRAGMPFRQMASHLNAANASKARLVRSAWMLAEVRSHLHAKTHRNSVSYRPSTAVHEGAPQLLCNSTARALSSSPTSKQSKLSVLPFLQIVTWTLVQERFRERAADGCPMLPHGSVGPR